ncbi:hypothetical protein LTR94_038256, partial [Friedmanniomyces endolithicus]
MADSAETVKKTVEQTAAKAKEQAETMQAASAKAFRETMDKSVAARGALNPHGKKKHDAI